MNVVGPTSFTQTVSLEELASWNDLPNPSPYEIRRQAGKPVTGEPIASPVSLRSVLLDHLDQPLSEAAIKQVYFENPLKEGQTSSYLSPTNIGEAGANGFINGRMPAVYVAGDSDAVGYVRPLRLNDPDDVNGGDFVQGRSGQAVELVVRTDQVQFTPTITLSKPEVKTKKNVRLAVEFPAAVTRRDFTYAWTFGDGQTSSSASPVHSWSSAQTYRVGVTLTSADATLTGRATLAVHVVGDTPQPTPTPSPTPTPGDGDGGPDKPVQGSGDEGTAPDQDPTERPGTSVPAPPASAPKPVRGGDAARFVTVSGSLLVGPDGVVEPVTTDRPDGTLDLSSPRARRGSEASNPSWAWWLLFPAALGLGAWAEAKPWRRGKGTA